MKYVVFRRYGGGDPQDIPIIFPDFLTHSHVAHAILKAILALGNASIVSAGTCDVVCLSCTGRSETLSVESRAEDRTMINCYDYSRGLDVPNNPEIERMVMLGSANGLVEALKA